jgi:dTDP-4-amino-4,6-dideoxygalactose transaminase
MIPFVDLRAQYESIQSEIDGAIQEVVGAMSFVGGPFVEKFEDEFAQYAGTKHCIACANGTDSLEIALEAMGIGDGDEVVVPANSWISTSEAVTRAGGIPVFADVLPGLYTIDPEDIERKLSSRTRAIIPVHLYGLPAQMDKVMEIAQTNDLLVLEDCAQAHGATYNGQKVGTFGDAASFSFYPGKNLGAYGDGGGIVTNSDEIAQMARQIGNHGQLAKHAHELEGRNSRLDAIQAAILSVKLPHIDHWNQARNEVARWYDERLDGIVKPVVPKGSTHVFHLYVVQVENRDAVQQALNANDIQYGVHYPKALPFLNAYAHLEHKESAFPVAASNQGRILSLPMYPELTQDAVDKVCEVIHKS